MSSPKIEKFVNIFTSNAAAVLSTITNQSVELKQTGISDFNFNQIESDINMPAVLLSIAFSGDYDFQSHLILPKKLVAMLADLMMLGDGDIDYIPEEHNDAAQEMLNQVLGSMSAELSGENIKLTGTAHEVEVTDMEIQKDFMIDNQMVFLSFHIMDQEFPIYFVLDQLAIDSIEDMMPASTTVAQPSATQPTPNVQQPQSNSINQQPVQQEPVNLAHPSFADIQQPYQSDVKGNVNIDMLLDISLPVTVELGKKSMKIKQILDLGQGSVVELDKLVGDYVELMVNGTRFALGEIMVADENLAIRIVSLISREDRIKSLG